MGVVKKQIQIWVTVVLIAFLRVGLTSAAEVVEAKPESTHTYLYGAHPSGGIWGARVDLDTGKSETLDNVGYLSTPSEIGTVSYDQSGQQLLLEYFNPHRLDHGPLCRYPPNESTPLTNVTKFPIFENGVTDCIECQASSFAFYGNKVYFLMTGMFGPLPNATKKIQLRVFEPCENCSYDVVHVESLEVFGTPFLFNCSTMLAEVYSGVEHPDRLLRLKPGRSMKISSKNSKLEFFFQVFVSVKTKDMVIFETHLSLYHVTVTSEVVKLWSQEMPTQYAQWNIRALASVDYKDGMLCWTAGDRLYCGLLGNKGLEMETMLLLPADTVINGVCTGSNLDLLAIVTGVSIARAGPEKRIFFGCYPNWLDLGGTGLIKISGDWSNKDILKVIDSNGLTRFAGSVFTSDVIPTSCPIAELPLEICPSPPPAYSLVKDEPLSEGSGSGSGIESGSSGVEITEIKGHAISGHHESGSLAIRTPLSNIVRIMIIAYAVSVLR